MWGGGWGGWGTPIYGRKGHGTDPWASAVPATPAAGATQSIPGLGAPSSRAPTLTTGAASSIPGLTNPPPLVSSSTGGGPSSIPGTMTPAGQLTGFERTYWQENPSLLWAKILGLEATPDTHYAGWLGDRYAEVKAQADMDSLGNNDAQYLDQFRAALPGLTERYLGLPGWQQGKNVPVRSPGRYLNL